MANPFVGQAGQAIETSTATTKDLPAWYQTYTANLGTQGSNLAQNLNNQPLPAQSVAGFNNDQTQAFQDVQNNQGAWQPLAQSAATSATGIAPAANGWLNTAMGAANTTPQNTMQVATQSANDINNAASGSAQNWTDNAAKYMSPYTSSVVDNIARLGNQNWNNNIMPGINSSMIGSGQFGSTRNADVLGKSAQGVQNDILGQQAGALESGYNTSAGIFANDANRTLSQQQLQTQAATTAGGLTSNAATGDANRALSASQLQANTALQGANTATNALSTQANDLGALSKSYQTSLGTDAASLVASGNQQQQLQQTGLDTAYKNAMAARTDPWTQLQNEQGLLNNVQLPGTQATTTSAPASVYGPSAVSGALSAYYLTQGLNSDGTAPAAGQAPK